MLKKEKETKLKGSRCWDDLRQYVGMAFDRDGETDGLTAIDGGIFTWSEDLQKSQHVNLCKLCVT